MKIANGDSIVRAYAQQTGIAALERAPARIVEKPDEEDAPMDRVMFVAGYVNDVVRMFFPPAFWFKVGFFCWRKVIHFRSRM